MERGANSAPWCNLVLQIESPGRWPVKNCNNFNPEAAPAWRLGPRAGLAHDLLTPRGDTAARVMRFLANLIPPRRQNARANGVPRQENVF